MNTKRRLSASVDAELLEAAERAAASGRTPTLSAWVNDALRLKLEQERRREALAAFIADYEGEHGVITADEMKAAERRARARALSAAAPRRPRRRRAPRRS